MSWDPAVMAFFGYAMPKIEVNLERKYLSRDVQSLIASQSTV